MDAELFFGRFHPVLVHLPIGFILMGILLEAIGRWSQEKAKYHTAVLISLGFGILTGALALVTGFLLANAGQYSQQGISSHKWLAIGTLVVTTIIFFIKKRNKDHVVLKNGILLFALFGLLTLTGHNGGGLTHGSNYLIEHAPTSIQKLVSYEQTQPIQLSAMSIDSVIVYRDLIQPILKQKCYSCHNNEKSSGNLNLTAANKLFKSADSGQPVLPYNLEKSELYQRITIPNSSDAYMPPTGAPLNYSQIEIIKKWIELGADTSYVFKSEDLSSKLVHTILRDYGLDYSVKPYVDQIQVEAIDPKKIVALRKIGIRIEPISAENNLLDVEFEGNITKRQIEELNAIRDKITWLKISKSDLSLMELPLSKFEHLTRIDLYKSQISNNLLLEIAELDHLLSLNLFGTNVSDSSIDYLKNINSLNRIYLTNTNVTQKKIDQLTQLRKDIKVINF